MKKMEEWVKEKRSEGLREKKSYEEAKKWNRKRWNRRRW